jgi:hypothetical protein
MLGREGVAGEVELQGLGTEAGIARELFRNQSLQTIRIQVPA